MTMHTELYCPRLGDLDVTQAIRAIHEALLQLEAGEKLGFDCLDNSDAIAALKACMRDAGHIGYLPEARELAKVQP